MTLPGVQLRDPPAINVEPGQHECRQRERDQWHHQVTGIELPGCEDAGLLAKIGCEPAICLCVRLHPRSPCLDSGICWRWRCRNGVGSWAMDCRAITAI